MCRCQSSRHLFDALGEDPRVGAVFDGGLRFGEQRPRLGTRSERSADESSFQQRWIQRRARQVVESPPAPFIARSK
jgi:hypothetical protein